MRKLGYFLLSMLLLWTLLTFYAERRGPAVSSLMGESTRASRALIVYSPDPFYNLDEQVCTSVGAVLAESGWRAEVHSVRAAEALTTRDFDLYIFCANTYNWSPDWAVTRLAAALPLANKPVAAITLGSGSTSRAQRRLEAKLLATDAELIASTRYWLLRPNDESRLDDPNTEVANELATTWATSLVEKMATK